jgi:hypothetical protein
MKGNLGSWKMSKKIKVELTEKQFFTVSMTLGSHIEDIMANDYIDTGIATEARVLQNAINAMQKGYEEWKEGK